MTIARRLADFCVGQTYDDLPAEVVSKSKLLILDTLGVAIGSSAFDFGEGALKLSEEWSASSGVTVISRGHRVAPHHAALVNGILAHGQDFDDTHTESVVHSSAALVPAALACAEREKATGSEALLALILGTEISLRLALPARNAFHLRGFHTTSVACTFGAGIISALLGHRNTEDHLMQTLGVCGSFASGLLECIPAASSAKRLHAGWAGLSGIMAEDLARSGFTGPSTVVEGRLGLYSSMLRGQKFDLDEILEDLGARWHILDIRPKLYPCCHYLQAFIDCAKMLREKVGFDPASVVQVRARVAEGSVNMICEPWSIKLAPKTSYDARFSLPYAIATMLVRGRADLSAFEEDKLDDPAVHALMAKVSYSVDPAFSVTDMPAWIEVEFDNGTVLTESLAEVRGNAANPIQKNEIMAKFRDCTRGFDPLETGAVAEHILELDEAPGVEELMGKLASLRSVVKVKQ